MTLSPNLRRLAEAHGLITQFTDGDDQERSISRSTAIAVLKALDVDATTPASLAKALTEVDRRDWLQPLPPVVVARQGTAVELPVCWPDDDSAGARCWVELDDDPLLGGSGGLWQLTRLSHPEPTRQIDGITVRRLTFQIPGGLPLGWHTIEAVSAKEQTASCRLVIVPVSLEVPSSLTRRRIWGLMTQLYASRSSRSWGIGDFADLADLAYLTGHERGADFILVNPTHAGQFASPITPSPYLPSSRAVRNPLYIRPELITEFAYADNVVTQQVRNLADQAALDNHRSDRVDRDRVWLLKSQALETIYRLPRTCARQAAFTAFKTAGGIDLKKFALFNVLEELGQTPPKIHGQAADDQALGQVLSAALQQHADRVDFHCWLQWIADEQLAEAQRSAKAAGMHLGLMADLAVGVHPSGADAWALADVLAGGVTVGAPPDSFNQQGQDWSQPPWRPDRLAAAGYAPYRTMIRTVLKHAGAIRIDHILGLFRLWWIPAGAKPTDGCYVRFDHEAMVGIVALEAKRVGAMVVGEDLGVVEPWVHEYLPERGILGSNVLWFERDDDGKTPRAPQWYRRHALTTVTVHDLPPTPAYLMGEHVKLRDRLGLLTKPLAEEQAAWQAERSAILALLRQIGLIPESQTEPPVDQLVLALHRFLRATPSLLIGVSLADAVGEQRAQNVPGTNNQYPNWRVPLADQLGNVVLLDDLLNNPHFLAVTAAVSGR
ncbi:MAG: 4-alpha-glucanotransferase [Bifidobacteriaceae bacterium]|jgi:4-alpha-glucanotransferase|nr:4-alpha-glucanotransferase [Bifidobacteriaceae bacterium]